jgi:hypothetical protein
MSDVLHMKFSESVDEPGKIRTDDSLLTPGANLATPQGETLSPGAANGAVTSGGTASSNEMHTGDNSNSSETHSGGNTSSNETRSDGPDEAKPEGSSSAEACHAWDRLNDGMVSPKSNNASEVKHEAPPPAESAN